MFVQRALKRIGMINHDLMAGSDSICILSIKAAITIDSLENLTYKQYTVHIWHWTGVGIPPSKQVSARAPGRRRTRII